MQFEIEPGFYTTQPLQCKGVVTKTDYKNDWLGVPDGVEEAVLAEAQRREPKGKDFRIDRTHQLGPSWHAVVPHCYVAYQRPYNRYYIEINTLEELMACIDELMSGECSEWAIVERGKITMSTLE